MRFTLWCQGPEWLTLEHPRPRFPEGPLDDEIPEQRVRAHAAIATPMEFDIPLRFSELHRLLRVTAWCRRWLRSPHLQGAELVSGSNIVLTVQKLEDTLQTWIRHVQTT